MQRDDIISSAMDWFKNLFQGSEQTERLREVENANAYFAPIIATKTLTPIKVNINLEKNEQCYFAESGVKLAEPRAIRYSKSGGYSARIVKGLWVNTGRSVSEAIQKLRIVDTGSLFLTNQRLIFLGDVKTLSVKYGDILANNPMTTAIMLSLANGKNECLYINNAAIISGLLALAPYGEKLKNVPSINMNINAV
jgi:hypothetical protein